MIHPTSIIHKGAKIDKDVDIGPYSIIEEKVVLSKGVKVGAFCHIKGNTFVGEGTCIYSGCIIGEKPQVLGFKDNVGKLNIGSNNIIREYTTIHTSTSPQSSTSIGNNNFFMAFSHIAHDCVVGNNVVICNGVLLAGHVKVEDGVFISGNSAVHQFTRIGRLSMIGGLSRVNQDVPPFMMVIGNSCVWGLNIVGLKRNGFSSKDINEIKKIFNILYREGLSLKTSLKKLEEMNSEFSKEVLLFIKESKRGICGFKKSGLKEKLFLEYPLLLRQTLITYNILKKVHLSFQRKLQSKQMCII